MSRIWGGLGVLKGTFEALYELGQERAAHLGRAMRWSCLEGRQVSLLLAVSPAQA